MEFHNRLLNEAAKSGGQPQVASASIGLGPGGGFQTGQISPVSITLLNEIRTMSCNATNNNIYINYLIRI